MFYLAPYVGAGTRRDPFRPLGSEQPGWSSIDLRANCTRREGYALVHLPEKDRRLTALCEDRSELVHRRLERKLGVTVERAPFASAVARLLLRPPVRGWKRLHPTGRRYEIHLGGLLWASSVLHAASATDNFNRADEASLLAPWTQATGGGTAQLASNTVHSFLDTDTLYHYAGAAVTADQYAQAILSTKATGDGGPAVRVKSSTMDGYFAEAATTAEGFYKLISTVASLVSAVTTTIAAGDTVRLEAQGSTLRYFKNGAAVTGSPFTDTSITVANDGAGMFWFSSSDFWDDWAGGDLAPGNVATVAWLRA
jgi:hypothetical protein